MHFLTARLSERGLFSDPPLTDASLDRDRDRFSRMAPPVPVQAPLNEASLIDYIRANHRLIPPLDQYGPKIFKEHRLPSGKRVNLVIKDVSRRRWLLVEVELKGLDNREGPAQLIEYMNEVDRNNLTPDGYRIEGMISAAAAPEPCCGARQHPARFIGRHSA